MSEYLRIFRGDKYTRGLGSRIPHGSRIRVIKHGPRRRVLVEYEGQRIMTMLWCLRRLKDGE